MKQNPYWRVIVAGAMICALVGSGCFGRNKKKSTDSDTVFLDEVGSDIGLTERFEDGELVTDVQFNNVLFVYDSYQIAPTEIARIEAVGDYLRSESGVKLVAEGHCDERGSREYNLVLGEHRALAVRAHLVRLGISGARIQTRSYGEEKPDNPGHTAACWQENRRVEFKLYR